MKHLLISILFCILLQTVQTNQQEERNDESDDEQNFPLSDDEFSIASSTNTDAKWTDDSDSSNNSSPSRRAGWDLARRTFMPGTNKRWEKIHRYIADVVANYRKEVYLHKLVENTQYKMPPPFEGVVKARFRAAGHAWRHRFTEYGRAHKKFMQEYGQQAYFGANEDTLETIMLYVQLKLHSMLKKYERNANMQLRFKQMHTKLHALRQQIPDAGCLISFAPHERTLNNAFLFDQGLADEAENESDDNDEENNDDDGDANKNEPSGSKRRRRPRPPFLYQTNDEEDTVQDGDDDDDDDDEESADEINTFAVMQAIQYGRDGFGPEATLDWSNLPEPREEKEKPIGGIQKFIVRLKAIYQSIKKTMTDGTEWTANKGWRRKDTKNASNLELSEPLLAQRTNLLSDPQKGEIKHKADSAIYYADKLLDNNAPENSMDHILKLQQKKPNKGTSAERKAKYRKMKEHLKQQQVHPFDFLAGTLGGGKTGDDNMDIEFGGLRYTIVGKTANEKQYMKNAAKDQLIKQKMDKETETCSQLAKLVEDTLYIDNKVDPEGVEFRGRLGAQIVNSVISMKDLRGLLIQMQLSILGSGCIALFFDAFLWPLVIGILTPVLGVFVIPLSVALYSLTPLFAETFDSLVIKRAIAMSRGAPLLPKKAVLVQNFRAALASGTVASFGSIANNAMEYATGLAWLPMLTLTNMLATATSAAMVPSEIHEAEEQTNEHVLRLISKGFFPLPNMDEQMQAMDEEEKRKRQNWFKPISAISAMIKKRKEEKAAKQMTEKQRKAAEDEKRHELLEWFVRKRVDHVMDLTKTTGMARNSLSTGIVLSLTAAFAPFYALQTLGLVSANLVKIILIIFNAPTEILSMGVDRIMSTKGGWDKKKNRRMVGLIVRKAIEQLKTNGPMPIITDEEVYNVYYSNFMARRMNKFGKKIVDLMTVAGKFFKYCGGKIVSGVSMLAKLPLVRNLVGAKRQIREKLQNNFLPLLANVLIVENWKKDTVYLITYPRLSAIDKESNVPVISPAALKLEAWLMLRGLPFYRVTNAFLLADLFGQRVPFVELNGAQMMGTTDQIIERLEKWEVARKSAYLMMSNVNMAHNGHNDKEKRKELRKNERHIRRLFDEIVTRCLMFDRNMSIEMPHQDYLISLQISENKMGFLGKNRALWKQLLPTLPRFYLKWFNKKLRLKDAKFWELFFKTEAEDRKYTPGYEILSEDEQLVKDMREKEVPMAMQEIFRRYKRKLYNEMKGQKVREYNAENDTWEVVHSIEQLTKDVVSKKSVKYGDLSPDQIADKVIDAMKVATNQFKTTIAMWKKKKEPMFLFGDKPTPADVSLFAHLVQLFDTPLHIVKLKNHIETVKKQSGHEQHVLLRFVASIKERLQWDRLKYSEDPDKKPFNFQSVPNEKALDTYDGPFDLKYKDVPSVDTTFMEFDDVEEKQEQEEFGAEEEEAEKEAEGAEEKAEQEDSAQKKEKRVKKKQEKKQGAGGGSGRAKERQEIRENLRREKEEKQRYDQQKIVTFAMFNEQATWTKLEKKRMLYEEPKDPGNFLWRYPKVVEFVARHILRITDCENENDTTQTGGPWMNVMENGLEKIERELLQNHPFAKIANVRQRKDNSVSYSLNKFLIAKERAFSARALFHLMALHFCKRFVAQQSNNNTNEDGDDPLPISSEPAQRVPDTPRTAAGEEQCVAMHMHPALDQLKRLPAMSTHAAQELLNKCDKMMKQLIDQVYDNYEQLIEPVYVHTDTHSEVTSFKPIVDVEREFFAYMPGDNGAPDVYRVDRVLLYYYPDVVQYVLHALMDVLNARSEVPLQFSFMYRYGRVRHDVKLRTEREQLIAMLDGLRKKGGQGMHAAQQNKHIARALISFAAAFLCVGKLNENDEHNCAHVHRQKAREALAAFFVQAENELDKHVKLFVHQVIVSYNELLAEEELDKFSTKIVAELELLPKGPGFFERLQSEYRNLIQDPPKEVEAEIKTELRKAERSPELQRMQQRSGFVDDLLGWWNTMSRQNGAKKTDL